MPTWLTLAAGPLFRFALALLLLGLLRLALLTIWDLRSALRRAGDRSIPHRQIWKETLSWMLPLDRLHRVQGLYSFASFALHLGILSSVLFLDSHLDILQRHLGFAWPAVSRPVLDILALVSIFAAGYLLLHRVYAASSQKLSRPMDYLLLVMLSGLFFSGYLAGRPWNPIPYEGLMLFHTLDGLLLAILIPFTKVAHCILYPLIRLSSEVAWHFPPHGGSEVIEALYGAEGRRI